MEWKEEYSLGIPNIDKEHQALVQYVTEVESAVAAGDWEATESAIGRLASFAVTHFSFEETMMSVQHFADIGPHIEGHRRFLADLASLQSRVRGAVPPENLVEMLQDWLVEHITTDDRRYSSSLTEKDRDWVQRYIPS